jgi:DNA polymerase III subunit beta
MKVTCDRRELHEGLGTVARAVSGRSSLPILGNVLLDPGTDALRLAATDLELGMERLVPARVSEPGQITLPARTLSEIVNVLPEAEVTIAADTSAGDVVITCRRSEYRIHGLPAEEFPVLPEVGSDAVFTLPEREMRDIIRQTIVAASTEDTRPILMGAYTVLQDGVLTMVATDTHRLAYRQGTPVEATGEVAAIIPARALSELGRVLDADSDQPVQVRVDKNQALFRSERATVSTRLIEGQFPRYEKVIPSQHTRKLTIPKEELLQALRRVDVVARDNSHRVVFRTSGELLTLTAEAGDLGRAFEEVEVIREGDDIQIAFNARYVLEVLNVLDGEGLYLEMTEPLRPAVVRPVEGPNYLMVVMPMSLQ